MDPPVGSPPYSYPQRPQRPPRPPESPFQSVDLGSLENGQFHRRKEEEKHPPWQPPSLSYEYPESSTSRFSSSTAGSIHKPSLLEKIRGPNVGWIPSIKAIILSSWVNIFLLAIPVLWTLHFLDQISHLSTFILSFLSLIPIIKLLDFGAENLALYCGQDIGDLILISLNNAVEAILALWLLAHWELRLLQSSIIGVTVLRLLLIPGISFIVGGVRIATQQLHPHITGLNHSLLTMGVLAFLLPITFFTALDRGIVADNSSPLNTDTEVISDYMRGELLKLSRGMAVILLAVYICARVFLHKPPGDENLLEKDAPEEMKELARKLEGEDPTLNFSLSVILSLISVTLMAITAEILVESIEPMRDKYSYSEEWFGLILLPLVSFSADAVVSIVNFVRNTYFGHSVTHTMASTRHVDDAIQFIMFWAPILVLLGWVMQRPMSLLFDLFEVAILIGSCFLLNFVTEDSKTNWAEGVMLVALYLMVVVSAWFYPQQPEIGIMLSRTSIAEALKVSGELDDSSSMTTTLVSAIISTVTATTTIGIGAVVATPTPTPTPNAKVAATPLSGDASNQALSEKLQELMKLVEQSQKEQKTFEKELNSLKASRTTSSIHPENTQHRNMEDLD